MTVEKDFFPNDEVKFEDGLGEVDSGVVDGGVVAPVSIKLEELGKPEEKDPANIQRSRKLALLLVAGLGLAGVAGAAYDTAKGCGADVKGSDVKGTVGK